MLAVIITPTVRTSPAVPAFRGRGMFGQDNAGGTAAGRLTTAVSGVDGTTIGAVGGDQHAQEDTIDITQSGTITATAAPHTHTVTAAYRDYTGDGYGSGGWGQNELLTTNPTTESITVTNGLTITAASNLMGASQNMPPAMVVPYLCYVGA